MTPRGIRANNPGNIDHHPGTDWQGLDDPPTDGRFCRFVAPVWGIRAIARILTGYQRKRGIKTVLGIINRWAPPVENDTGAYVKHVADICGVGPDQKIDVTKPAVMRSLITSIIEHENGQQPYDAATIDTAINLAG